MINKNFWDLLAEKQDSLTKSGTIIADYLTKHAEEAQFLSISSLAKACNMAEAMIFRQDAAGKSAKRNKRFPTGQSIAQS